MNSGSGKAREMDADTAARIMIRPYVTERTFEMVESEAKICFIVSRTATKHEIVDAIKTLYGKAARDVNTARTIYGKKAFVQFENAEMARDLATDIGML
ncbi:MAG: 50S ribosomal protein L23 [Thaumarchaeota archaeon]|nr:50S ribosomal protein L23 [Nitrososphaerota archaeon]MDE0266921.1 50S ribosomal protein L23 [Nitrososphaerota archaeon]MDE0525456.1 50S ribosomal protein L23 [Nitrososphaerota archaeon]